MQIQLSNQVHFPQTLVGISFEDSFRAQEFLVAMSDGDAAERLKLKEALTFVRDDLGKTVAHESIDPTSGRAALIGAIWAGLLGLLTGGPVDWIAGLAVGAGAGAAGAKLIDLGLPDDWVHWFRETDQPGTATVALLVEDLDRNPRFSEAFRFTGAELVDDNLDDATIAWIGNAPARPTVA